MMNRLMIHSADADKYDKLLKKFDLPSLEIFASARTDQAEKEIESCNIVLGEPAMVAGMLQRAKRLEWVQSTFAGVEIFCQEGLRRDYTLTGVKGIHDPLISEYVVAYILALERHLFETKENQAAGIWTDMPYRGLKGLILGICGFGSIGRHLARTGRYFGMQVLAYKRTPEICSEVDKIYTGEALEEFVGLVDYLVLILPNTPATTGLINQQTLGRMKPSAVLINVGRGNAVVEKDLADALENKRLRAAILDVFEKEPLPPESPLWKMPNAIITPHNAAFSFPEDVAGIFHANYLHFIAGKPLNYVVDFTRGY